MIRGTNSPHTGCAAACHMCNTDAALTTERRSKGPLMLCRHGIAPYEGSTLDQSLDTTWLLARQGSAYVEAVTFGTVSGTGMA